MSPIPAPVVFVAPTMAAARRAAGGRPGALAASPKRRAALTRAVREGLSVVYVASRRDRAFWTVVGDRFELKSAPALLRGAILGIARHREPAAPVRKSPRVGPSRALWIEGDLDNARARALLRAGEPPGLWILEDFEHSRISGRLRERLSARRIRVAVIRPLLGSRVYLP